MVEIHRVASYTPGVASNNERNRASFPDKGATKVCEKTDCSLPYGFLAVQEKARVHAGVAVYRGTARGMRGRDPIIKGQQLRELPGPRVLGFSRILICRRIITTPRR